MKSRVGRRHLVVPLHPPTPGALPVHSSDSSLLSAKGREEDGEPHSSAASSLALCISNGRSDSSALTVPWGRQRPSLPELSWLCKFFPALLTKGTCCLGI